MVYYPILCVSERSPLAKYGATRLQMTLPRCSGLPLDEVGADGGVVKRNINHKDLNAQVWIEK